MTETLERPAKQAGIKVVEVTDSMLERIEVLRKDEAPQGFQRNLSRDGRAARMAEEFSNGGFCPPVILGQIGTRLICIDGQHRLKAREIKEFPLYAVIKPSSMEDGAYNFVKTNTEMRRVSLSHRLEVDPSPFAKKLRAFAKEYGTTYRSIYQFICGYMKSTRLHWDVEPKFWSWAEVVLKEWSADKRWSSEDEFYNTAATLSLVGYLTRDSNGVISFLKRLKKIDFRKGTDYAQAHGASSWSRRAMLEYVQGLLNSGVI